MLTRRSLLTTGLTAAAAFTACSRPKAKGFSGYAFIANQEGGAVAAVDLEVFAVAKHIRVDGAPTDVVARAPTCTCLCADARQRLGARNPRLESHFRSQAEGGRQRHQHAPAPDQNTLYVLCRDPRRLVAVALNPLRIDWELRLPEDPYDFDISSDGTLLAISHRDARAITFVDLAHHTAHPIVKAPGEIGLVRFQYSRQLIAANLSERMLSIYNAPSRRLMVNLPLAVRPDQLCFNSDGGQLFVTGDGMDAVVVVYPSFTPEIGETVLAGHNPGAMAASQSAQAICSWRIQNRATSAFWTSRRRRVVAVTPVGTEPSYITITPDDQYALVLNQASGDMAVIRIPNVTRAVNEQRRWKKGPLFMLIPVGSKPVSAAIMRI